MVKGFALQSQCLTRLATEFSPEVACKKAPGPCWTFCLIGGPQMIGKYAENGDFLSQANHAIISEQMAYILVAKEIYYKD